MSYVYANKHFFLPHHSVNLSARFTAVILYTFDFSYTKGSANIRYMFL